MVEVEVRVAQRKDEFARLEIRHLRHHQREQRVGGDVERHAEEKVGAALVHLARERAVGDVELEQRVARRQRHACRRRPGSMRVTMCRRESGFLLRTAITCAIWSISPPSGVRQWRHW